MVNEPVHIIQAWNNKATQFSGNSKSSVENLKWGCSENFPILNTSVENLHIKNDFIVKNSVLMKEHRNVSTCCPWNRRI